MNFFESQDRARKNTFQLILLFSLAVIILIVMVNLLVMLAFGFIDNEQMSAGQSFWQQMDWRTFATISSAVVLVVLGGSLYKIMALSAGGKVVAEGLGGQLIAQNTTVLNQRKLLNVVEEMAIASGTPAPPVYLLADENGINAFAAGFSPKDAVIGVTQGAIDHLSRDQLQGVIAHEFSHIFNGDMRLNIRLIGVLNGILILGIIGYHLLYSTSRSRRGRDNGKGAAGILALAIGLIVIGFAGTFFGGLIKAAVSRQREYLADASAVQFTRNPEGIAGALKRIGGLEFGSLIEDPGAAEISHAFFAQGVSGLMQTLSATHPPLAKRILHIDPHWDGKFATVDKLEIDQSVQSGDGKVSKAQPELAKKMSTIAAGASIVDLANSISQIGNPTRETVDYVRALIAQLPTVIKDAAREPYGARAVVYALLLDKDQQIRLKQLAYLHQYADANVAVFTRKLLSEIDRLEAGSRLPLIDIAIPALKQLSLSQYQIFRVNMDALIDMDFKLVLKEWTLRKILFIHLDAHFFKHPRSLLASVDSEQLKPEIALLLSVLTYAGQQEQVVREDVFITAVEALGMSELKLVNENAVKLSDLDTALQKLEKLTPMAKPMLLHACAVCIMRDQKIDPVEVELLRAFADVLACPMPPLISYA
ncbi:MULTISPECIES: M48 family metallopeptidase [Shewanella]|uniref:Heat-shock protein HtpX n=1 Tax=Shewanella psychromarinicola TaxID=2487742 RepID=A0A3N4E8H2_9GAMM|nr:M48 family metallopeptidase [Shewanella psychromarinicola]AZG36668.1 heat-shock protein HtpX [Shewanella psychromarinicola]MCL1082323.1 M48 family metallopeptidase [Shewanella psychromarinicola]RPA34519.1 heat-shock protein HtpX [Shewanella psychromarinicola]